MIKKTICYYTGDKKYMGWQAFVSLSADYLDIKSWIDSGNYLKINGSFVCDMERIVKHFG